MKKIALLSALMVAVAGSALAFNAPASGDFMYELYDVAVNRILTGPIGFVGAIMAFVAAAVLAIRQMVLPAVGTILAGVFLLKSNTLIDGLGALIG